MSKSQIIIVYSNLDDKPEIFPKSGWVTTLSNNLLQLLKRLDGDFYTLSLLTEYDIDPESYPTQPSVVIPILSKNFFQSPLLSGYLEVFEKDVQKITRKKRISNYEFISVFKNRVEDDLLSDYIISNRKKYFYTVDPVTDFVTEIKYEDDPGKDNDYWMKLYDVANLIKNYRQNLKSPLNQAEDLIDDMKLCGVYLAQVGLDLFLDRENIFRELYRNNIKVFQVEKTDSLYEDLVEEINGKLNKCHISIHLIGEDPGKLVKNRGLTLVEIENQLASQHSKQINDQPRIKHADRFKRVVWLDPIRENVSVKQKLFIENLKKDFVNIQNAEILEVPIEELKNFVNNLIEYRSSAMGSTSSLNKSHKKSIYFICNKKERKHCTPISKLLKDQGYDVVFSNFEGELLSIRDVHFKNLNECNGTLIYYGNNSENWVKSKLFDSVKALGMGRIKGSNPTAIIVDSEKKINLDLYIDTDKLMYLKNDNLTKETFKPFLSRLDNTSWE